MNPIKPAELISLEDSTPNENDLHFQLELASEEPKTEEENTKKLNNQIKHMEFNIQQNRKRCENLSKDCYDILQSTELLAFDFLFADYLLGYSDSQAIYSFFEQCIHPSFDLSTGKDSDFEKASEHINYLQSIIKKSSQSLLEGELKPSIMPKRTSEFVLYLTDQKTKLDREISRIQIRSQKDSQTKNEEEEESVFQIEENEPDTSGLPQSFSNWIQSEFDFLQKEPENQDSNSENVNIIEKNPSDDKELSEINHIIACIAHRLSHIEELKNHIQQLKRITVDPSNLDSRSCDPAAIESSPFFVGLKNNCQLLLSAFDSMKSQELLIPTCFNSLEVCRSQLLQLSTSLQNSIDTMQAQINKMRDSISSRQNASVDHVNKLRPYIDSIFMKNELPSITSDDPNLNFSKEYDLIRSNLEDDIKRIKDFEEMSESEAMMTRKKTHENIDKLDEIKQKREELGQLFKQMNEIITLIEEKDASILSLVMNFCKADAEIELHKEEYRLLSSYEEELKEVLKSLKFNEMGEWCDKIGEIGQSFYHAAQEQQEVIKKLQKMTENTNIEEEIGKKKVEIEELSNENCRLCKELEKEKFKLDEVIQERVQIQEKLKEKIENDDWIPDYIDKNDEESMKRFKQMVICPICSQNRRDSILTSCGHPICRACLQKSEGVCPICSVPFTEDNIKPFFMQ